MLHEQPSGIRPVLPDKCVSRPAVPLDDLAEALGVLCVDLAERVGELLELGFLSRVQCCLEQCLGTGAEITVGFSALSPRPGFAGRTTVLLVK